MRVNKFGLGVYFLCFSSGLYGCGAPDSGAEKCVVESVPQALEAGASVVVGPEIGTDKPTPMPTTLGMYPALASDGNGFLSVQSIGGRIKGIRVDTDGTVDLNWLDFGVANYAQYYSDVAFGAGRYLVAWSQSLESGGNGSVQGRFVKPDGTLEGTASFQLSSGDSYYPSLASDGTHFALTWMSYADSTSTVRYALFNADGSKVLGSDQALTTTGSVTNPRVAAGTNFDLVTWQAYEPDSYSGNYKTFGVRIDKNGAVRDIPARVIGLDSYSSRDAAVAAGGSRFLVTWTTTEYPQEVHGSVMDEAGGVVQDNFVISHSPGAAVIPTADFDGSNFVVAWADDREGNSVYGATVSLDGVVLGTTDNKLTSGGPRSVYSGGSDQVNLAFNGSRHMLSYLGDGVEGTLLDKSLSIAKDEFNVTSLPGRQGFPRLAWDGKNYVIAWTDEADPDWSKSTARALRISPAGKVLDPTSLPVTDPGTYAWSVGVASAGKGDSWLTYSDASAGPQLLRSLASDGSLGSPKPLGAPNGNFDLVSNGRTYLATSATGDTANGAAIGHILDLNGTVGPEFRLDASTVNTGTAAVPTPEGYLVSYANSGTRVITVSDSGVVGASSLLQTDYTYISGACSGEESLVAWGSSVDGAVHGRFFKNGTWSGEEFRLSEGAVNNGYPSVTWDGTSYYVAWEIADADNRNHQLLGRSVTRTGVLGPAQTLTTDDTSGVMLASNGQGQMLVSYIKWQENSYTRRIYSRVLSPEGAASGGTSGAGGQGSGGATSPTTGGGGTGATGPSTSGGSGGISGSSGWAGNATGGTGASSSGAAGGGTSGGSGLGELLGQLGCSVGNRGAPSTGWSWLVAGAVSVMALRRRNRGRR